MPQQKLIMAAVALLSTQVVNAAMPVGADAPVVAAPGGLTDAHAGGISVSEPSAIVPGGGDSSMQPLIIQGGAASKGATIPAINPLSLSPSTSAFSTSAIKPSASFLNPQTETELGVKYGTLHLMPGCLVLLVSAEDTVSIYNLHDDKDKSVFVECDGRKLNLTPGKQVTLTRSKYADFAAANKLPWVVYSSTEKQQINEELVCFHGSYDVYSLIFRFPPFKELLASKDPKTRHTAEKVLKTSVIMSQMAATAKWYQLKASPAQGANVK